MNQRGLTLIEVIVAMAIFAILLTIAAPSLQKWRHDAAVKGVAYDIMSGLRKARDLAITSNSTVTVTVSPGSHQLTIDGTGTPLAKDVDFVVDSGDGYSGDNVNILFYPSGKSGSTLSVMVNNDPNMCVEIETKTTGLARM